MIVVADTTPLLYLARIDRLELLRALYSEVLIPVEVREELVERRPDAAGVVALRAAPWIIASAAPATSADDEVLAGLDRGEAAAFRLAVERRADLVLVDERAGRAAARALRLHVRGTLGVLVEARRRALLDAVRPVLEDLEREGFRASSDLRAWALAAVGEGP